MKKLENKKFAILATDGFEKSEFTEPMKAIKEHGGTVEVVSIDKNKIKAWSDGNWDESYDVDKVVSEVKAEDYDGLVLPGGVINPDQLRNDAKAVDFVKGFFSNSKQKPVAAICHGPWTLAEANVLKGRKVTSYGSIKTDLKNAGANWVDEEVVVDEGLVTSRSPEDMKPFINKMVEEFSEGSHKL